MVSQLILEGQHAWITALVHELFDPEDVQAILSIPLPIRSNEDKLIWVLSHELYHSHTTYQRTPSIPNSVEEDLEDECTKKN